MLALTPRGQELEFHVNLLRHGRRTCHAQRPRCPECALRPDVPVGEVVTTYLEITRSRRAIRPARGSAEIVRVDPPDGAVNRRFYEGVGARLRVDRPARPRRRLVAGARRGGRDVGRSRTPATTSCARTVADVEIAYFGLLPAFHGRGWGGALLEHALRRGFELGGRVWVHTCSLDGPHALANYEARGLVPYAIDR